LSVPGDAPQDSSNKLHKPWEPWSNAAHPHRKPAHAPGKAAAQPTSTQDSEAPAPDLPSAADSSSHPAAADAPPHAVRPAPTRQPATQQTTPQAPESAARKTQSR